jgi:hypothetical protein
MTFALAPVTVKLYDLPVLCLMHLAMCPACNDPFTATFYALGVPSCLGVLVAGGQFLLQARGYSPPAPPVELLQSKR